MKLLCGRTLGCYGLLVAQPGFFLALRRPHLLSLHVRLLCLSHFGLLGGAR